jgi:hypothetical protein
MSFIEVPGVIWLIIKALDTPPSDEKRPFLRSPTLRPKASIEEGDKPADESMSAPGKPGNIPLVAEALSEEVCSTSDCASSSGALAPY